MSNTQRASLVGRLSIVTILLGLSFGPGVSALAQTQVAASSTARPVASAGEKKSGHHPAGNRTASSESRAEAVRAASTVRNVTVRRDGNDLLATIELDGQASFNHFTLTGPHRVVIDVRKTSNQATPLLSLGENGIERVRTGNFQGNVRIVFDAASRQQYQISREGSQILVRFPGKADLRGPESNARAARKSNLPGPAPLAAAAAPTPKPEPVKADRKAEATRTEAASVKPAAVPTPNQPLVRPTPAKPETKITETKIAAAPVASTPSSEKATQKASAELRPAKPEAKPEMTAKANEKAAAKEARVLPFEARVEKPHSNAGTPPAKQAEKKSEAVSKAAADKAPVIAQLPAVSTQNRMKMTPANQPKQVVPVLPTPVVNVPKPVANAPKPAVVAEQKAEQKVQPKPAPVETKAAPAPAIITAPVNQKNESARESQPHATAVASAQQPKLAPTPVPVATPAPASTPAPRVTDKPSPVFNANDYRKEGFTGEPIKLDLKSVDIREVLRFIADTYKVNFVVDKSVSESVPVTVSVEEVPWNRALDALLKSNRLGIQVEGNILRVMAQSAIAEEDDVRRKQRDAQLQAAPLVTELIRLNYARAFMGGDAGGGSGGSGGSGGGGGGGTKGGLEAVIKSRLSTRGTIEPDSRTNTLVITDVPESIAIIKDMIRKLDVPEPQVEIEARIVIANRNFARDLGVQLGAVVVGNKVGNNGVGAFSTLPNPPGPAVPSSGGSGSGSGSGGSNGGLFGTVSDTLRAAGANSVLGLTTGLIGTAQITAILSAAESKGNVKTISTPRITAQNNQKANIVNGVQIPVQTETNNTVTVSFVTAALKLEITPQITSLGTVMLHVIAENNSVNLAIATRNAPGINTQRAETQVLVPDGGTTIIGGINIETESNSQQRTPGVSRIPGLGELFKRRVLQRSNDEILFFITPRIYKTLEAPVLTSGN
ncbi:MAG: type IV pilus secretin PilQ [Blastocatellia bacterium]